MFSIKLGYDKAVGRIEGLLRDGYESEALVTSVFAVEKMLRRTLKQLIVSSGFISKHADLILGRIRGIRAYKDHWHLYDPDHRGIVDIIGNPDWGTLTNAADMRNGIVHGDKPSSRQRCIETTKAVLAILNRIKAAFDARYCYSGWKTVAIRRKSALHADPKLCLPQ